MEEKQTISFVEITYYDWVTHTHTHTQTGDRTTDPLIWGFSTSWATAAHYVIAGMKGLSISAIKKKKWFDDIVKLCGIMGVGRKAHSRGKWWVLCKHQPLLPGSFQSLFSFLTQQFCPEAVSDHCSREPLCSDPALPPERERETRMYWEKWSISHFFALLCSACAHS